MARINKNETRQFLRLLKWSFGLFLLTSCSHEKQIGMTSVKSFLESQCAEIMADTNNTQVQITHNKYYRFVDSDSEFLSKRLLDYEVVFDFADSALDCVTFTKMSIANYTVLPARRSSIPDCTHLTPMRRVNKSKSGDMLFVVGGAIKSDSRECVLTYIFYVGSPYKCEMLYVADSELGCEYFVISCFIE